MSACTTPAATTPLPSTPEQGQTPQAMPTLTEQPSAAPVPPVWSLQDLALQTYGERLIESIHIPALKINSRVVVVGWKAKADPTTAGEEAQTAGAETEWDSPGQAVGWVVTSALPDQPGNIILYGHNNMYASIFKDLGKLSAGDSILLSTGQRLWEYQVSQVVILPALSSGDEQPIYQAYLQATTTPRLTLVSCWPPASNTHRVVVVAYPRWMP